MIRHLLLAIGGTTLALAGQAPEPDRLEDMTFAAFAHGDGRQKLSEFAGQALAVVGFADVYGGTIGAERAFKLFDQYGTDDLVVVLMHFPSGGTFPDAANGVDLAAWLMRRYPGRAVRLCEHTTPSWAWAGRSPFFAVVAPDGALIKSGDFTKGTKEFDNAVQTAMKQFATGWGTPEEAATRKLLYAKNAPAAARAKAPPSIVPEVDAVVERKRKIVEWLLGDGQWLRARLELDALAATCKGVAEWEPALHALADRLADERGKLEIDLDGKLTRVLKQVEKNGPDKATPGRLRAIAAVGDGTTVGARAMRLATLAELSLAIR